MPGLELAITQLSNRFASVETAVATIGATDSNRIEERLGW